jgi:nucleotide-binding universal stress UspA family protein
MSALTSILVPVDGSPPSLAALSHAVALAEDSGARLDVLHVETPDTFSTEATSPTPDELEDAMDDAFDDASTRLEGRVSRLTIRGEPVRTIIETARDGHYDLVVLGTHGRVGRLHALLGSVAEGVVRNAPCPVLTVREAGGGYQSFAERRHGRRSVAEPPPHHPR